MTSFATSRATTPRPPSLGCVVSSVRTLDSLCVSFQVLISVILQEPAPFGQIAIWTAESEHTADLDRLLGLGVWVEGCWSPVFRGRAFPGWRYPLAGTALRHCEGLCGVPSTS